ncbi:MAG: alpha-glucosidase C-terminal domain-containing protein [Anaerolineae bacterium]|nr:alpha-glucosidase C-terminal domain-containing protein [Anaerolineae bacterium]
MASGTEQLPEDLNSYLKKALQNISETLNGADVRDAAVFLRRCMQHGPDLYRLLEQLYGERDDFPGSAEAILQTAAEAFLRRPARLKQLDREREESPRWYQHHTMIGGVCYVDLFAGTLQGIKEKIPYFQELGLTYLHLMPIFRTPDGPDDGGYAVSSYREINPALGHMDDLCELAIALQAVGINLVLDFVFNHTANDHEWALKARAGDPGYQDCYFIFEDRAQPDAYEKTLREIFPDEHPGAFTFYPDIDKWVWTTFHTYQWDLNYRNPDVFRRMLAEMLSLANIGIDVLRLDAVPFIWKKLGTSCENLPEAHTIIRAFNALVRIAAPALIFKSEAIVHPDDVRSYFGQGEWAGKECEISYNPLLMVQLWEALATRHTHLLTYAMQHRFDVIPENCAWVNYIRSHDDIGWGFADEDAAAMQIDGFGHRQYLNRFYTGQEPGSFAIGYPFQFNPRTLDMRISGTAASLAGLEQAIKNNNPHAIDLAIRRILLITGITMSMGGMPLIYLGDEIGRLNDYTYLENPDTADDSRWVHRAPADWEQVARRREAGTVEARIFEGFTRLIGLRKQHPAFGSNSATQVVDTGNRHVYVYLKTLGDDQVLCIGNFTADPQRVPVDRLPLPGTDRRLVDLITGKTISSDTEIELSPYELMYLSMPQQ